MTTNGVATGRMAERLAAAGLHHVNVSCDSLQPAALCTHPPAGSLIDVWRRWTPRAGWTTPLKVNVVLVRDRNDDEILDFASFARSTGRVVRFIEFMPLDAQGEWDRARLVPGREVFDRISARWPLEPLRDPSGAPAERFGFTDGVGEIGLISSVTEPFCGTCNRLRLTADGAVRNCLFTNDEATACEIPAQ